MSPSRNLVIGACAAPAADRREVEICEHKGVGHPDTITDAVCDAASRALSRAYIEATGCIQHHNLDKGLLVAGQSRPRFGGGDWERPIRLLICGRAAPLPGAIGPAERAREAARSHLACHIRCDSKHFEIETAIHPGSANLDQVFSREPHARISNDTSFGVGYAPYSHLERAVLGLADRLTSAGFRARFPVAGDDFKIMGVRRGDNARFTIALAMVDRHVENAEHYFGLKREICDDLLGTLDRPAQVQVNTLDDPSAKTETGIYLTVSGLSAEMGDDGQVGRGNRVNGLISPCRPMSLEAAAGKNPYAHVGKLYNVLAHQIAQDIHHSVADVGDVHVRLVSAIGRPVDQPQLAEVELLGSGPVTARQRAAIRAVVDHWFERLDQVVEMILAERLRLF